jgi:multidrug resistance efflux pump
VNIMKRRALIIIIVAVVIIAGGSIYLYNLWQSSKYVTTVNANLGAPLIPVGSLATGQVIDVNVGIGDRVAQQEVIAEVGAPRYSDSNTRQGLQAEPGKGANVEAPLAGYVAAVWTYPGAVIAAGSPIVTLFDDSKIWVTANIDENDISKIQPGQEADVTVDSLGGKVLKGTVQGIVPATAASFSLLPSGNTSANFTKVSQVVPVRIILDNAAGLALIPGGSVEVKIKVK